MYVRADDVNNSYCTNVYYGCWIFRFRVDMKRIPNIVMCRRDAASRNDYGTRPNRTVWKFDVFRLHKYWNPSPARFGNRSWEEKLQTSITSHLRNFFKFKPEMILNEFHRYLTVWGNTLLGQIDDSRRL